MFVLKLSGIQEICSWRCILDLDLGSRVLNSKRLFCNKKRLGLIAIINAFWYIKCIISFGNIISLYLFFCSCSRWAWLVSFVWHHPLNLRMVLITQQWRGRQTSAPRMTEESATCSLTMVPLKLLSDFSWIN